MVRVTRKESRSLCQTVTAEDIKISRFLAFEAAGENVLHLEGKTGEDVLSDLFRGVDTGNARKANLALMIHMIVVDNVVAHYEPR